MRYASTLIFFLSCVALAACGTPPQGNGEGSPNGGEGVIAANNSEGDNGHASNGNGEKTDENIGTPPGEGIRSGINDPANVIIKNGSDPDKTDPETGEIGKEPEVRIEYVEKIVYQDREVKVPTIMRPVTVPEVGSEMWKELVESASFDTILAMMNDKAKAEGVDLPVEQKMALVSTYLTLYVGNHVENGPYFDAARDLFEELRHSPSVNAQWKLHTSSLIRMYIGEDPESIKAAQELHDAYLNALKTVPLNVDDFYHAIKVPDKAKKFWQKRLLKGEGRQNSVYRPGDTMKVNVVFTYLHGLYALKKEKWDYIWTSSAALYQRDENMPRKLGTKVREFRSKDLRLGFESSYAPDEKNQILLDFTLPADIRSETDYILVIDCGDGRREAQKETIFVDVKVRNRLPD